MRKGEWKKDGIEKRDGREAADVRNDTSGEGVFCDLGAERSSGGGRGGVRNGAKEGILVVLGTD